MKKILSLLIPVVLLSACSTPKYTYYFDHYDYNVGKKKGASNEPELESSDPDPAPTFIASADISAPQEFERSNAFSSVIEKTRPDEMSVSETDQKTKIQDVREKYLAMDRAEKRAFRKEVKAELKRMVREKKAGSESVSATNAMDNDLKLAIIFGAIGLTLSLFSGINAAFWVLGVIAIVVGVVFLIKWVVRQ